MSAQIHATVVRRAFHVRFDKLVRVSVYQSGEGGVADHGLLLGLGDDDHPHYHTDSRGDVRYYRKEAVDIALSGKANAGHTHAQLHAHANRATLDAIPGHDAAQTGQVLRRSAAGLEWGDAGQFAGGGDMLASVYDVDGDGIVDAAASVPWNGVTDTPSAFPPAAHSHDGDYDALGSATAAVAAHESRENNPHAVTAAQVGADPAGEAASQRAAHETAYDHDAYDAHLADTDNPHAVTAALAGADPAGEATTQRAAHEAAYDHTLIGTGGGATDHGALSGLEDDDHPQYHTDARGDARYERIDATILRTTDLAGPGAAETAARSDHDHDGSYDPAGEASSAVALHKTEPNAHTAASIGYDNGSSGAGGTNVQAAMDEVAGIAALAYNSRVPSGGSVGDMLVRQSDGAAGWQAPAAGGAGYINGLARRPQFKRTGPTEITLAGGCAYEIGGVIAFTSADIVYTMTGLSSSTAEWQYLYIKSGAAGTLTSADFVNSATAPVWDASRQGWYDASGNRCIFAVYTVGDGAIYAFVYANGLVTYQNEFATNISGTDLDMTYVVVQWTAPAFCRTVFGTFQNGGYGNNSATLFYRTAGETGSGVRISFSTGNGYGMEVVRVPVNADLQGEIVHNTNDGNLAWVYNTGWFLPEGM
ncbi:hypothetical protein [Oceanidesulfovibrio marinus]|uniref:Uncharacterized protein n=1 Tax=Oceanidesulfovibrio marinus TaxID=370038 RepID=A0ABX6NAV4_9BACT|nr:hypothetical protein [Oceanidesulfovibrio marinus]QJT07476.1 hypothetical protein E8L03_00440 [Oceanidesulfovibrio marinus]